MHARRACPAGAGGQTPATACQPLGPQSGGDPSAYVVVVVDVAAGLGDHDVRHPAVPFLTLHTDHQLRHLRDTRDDRVDVGGEPHTAPVEGCVRPFEYGHRPARRDREPVTLLDGIGPVSTDAPVASITSRPCSSGG